MKKKITNYALLLFAVAAIAGVASVNLSKGNQSQPLFVSSDIALAENYSCTPTQVLSCFVPSQNPADIGHFIPNMRAFTP